MPFRIAKPVPHAPASRDLPYLSRASRCHTHQLGPCFPFGKLHSHTHIGLTYRSLRGLGSTFLSACGWSGRSIQRGPHDRTPLPARSSSRCRIPGACLSELMIFSGPHETGAAMAPLVSDRCLVSHLRLERSMAETLSRPVFLHSPPLRCCISSYPCTVRGRSLSRPALWKAKPSPAFSSPPRADPACAVPSPLDIRS